MAAAVRKGMIVNIAADDLRVGDLVLIQTGDIVPADLKLLEASDLEVDKFELTGEIMPVPKCVGPETEVRVFQGSHVLRGHGKGVVIAAGEDTEYGKILKQSSRYIKDEKNQLLKSLVLRRLQKKLLKRSIFLRHEGVLDDIRKVDVFLFDKTGVLTSRDIEVKDVYLGGGNFSIDCVRGRKTWDTILIACTLCHDRAYHQTVAFANPVDRAMMSFAEGNGVNIDESLREYQRIYQKPFNSEERYMACGFDHAHSGKRIYFAKGDPEVLLKKCNSYVTPQGERRSKDFSFLSAVRVKMEEMSHGGSVVIALAYSENSLVNPVRNSNGAFHPAGIIQRCNPLEEQRHIISNGVKPPSSYTFLCLFRLGNPLKPDAKAVLRELSEKGIRNVIFTGDRTETGQRVGAEIGIENAAKFYLTGRDIDKMPLSEVARQCEYVSVFTRLSPSQKGIITRIFQQRGHRVAVIGDGTNDVIALKSADVGISFVERSSPMAKRAAKVLINDLTDILRIMETARHAHRQVGFIAACITLMFLMLLFGGYLFMA